MLLAVATDLASVDDVTVTIASCAQAVSDLPQLPGIQILVTESQDVAGFVSETMENGPFDNVLPIAPETDNTLADLVAGFREHEQSVLAASAETITVGTNKWHMFQYLQKGEVSTIPTFKGGDGFARCQANSDGPSKRISSSLAVLKPADGAGCDGIIRRRAEEIDAVMENQERKNNQIVQPFLTGTSWSVGIIGRGAGTSPWILPAAQQHIEWRADGEVDRPVYKGGTVGVELPMESRAELQQLLQSLLKVVDVEHGYVGVDLLRCNEAGYPEWLVTEINPRLCTSYIGYRTAAQFNLAAILLGKGGSQALPWCDAPVTFFCESDQMPGYN